MRTLHERNWVRVVGHREVPGRPELLGTTREFLDYFGLRSLDDLPTLAELRDLDDIKVQLEFPGGEPVDAPEALPAPPVDTVIEGDVIVAEDDSSDDESQSEDDDNEPGSSQAPTLVAAPPDSQER